MAPRRFLFVALAGLLATSALGCAAEIDGDEEENVGQDADAVKTGEIVVRSFGQPGGKLAIWGYDVKQDGRSKALKAPLAKEIFQDVGMNLLRVAIRAEGGHPSQGNVNPDAYAEDLEAIQAAKAARPGVAIFASVKLLQKQSFPKWVEGNDGVTPAKYARLVEDYLAYMTSKGVAIDYLGVDNERIFNEGNITPAKYNAIVADVRQWCKSKGVKVPNFIAAEDYSSRLVTSWVQGLWQTGAQFNNADAIGVHLYSKHRDPKYVADLATLANNRHGKRLWSTELHWNDLGEDGDLKFDDIKSGMLLAMDHFDQDFQMISWWSFQPPSRGTKSARIMSDLVHSTIGSEMLVTDDMDGKATTMNKFNSRAVKNDANHLTVWVANYDGKNHKDQLTTIANQKVVSASFVQWSPQSAIAGQAGNAQLPKKDPSAFKMDFPANTITRVTVTVK